MASHPIQKRLRPLESFVEPKKETKKELMSLPQEVLSAIFRLLVSDVDDSIPIYACRSPRNSFLTPLCLVCTTFAELARPIMMERVYFRTYQQVEAFTKLLAKEGQRMGARVRHVGVVGMVKTRTNSGRSSRIKHQELAALLALVPNLTSLAIRDVPVNVSSVHGSLVRALTALSNLTSLVLLQPTTARVAKSDSLLRRIIPSASSIPLRRLEIVGYYVQHNIAKQLQFSIDGTMAKHRVTSLDFTFYRGDDPVAQILDFAESVETLVLNWWDVDVIEKLFEVPGVWKKLRHLSLQSGRVLRTGSRIIGLLPASLTYLRLDPYHFDVPSLVGLKRSPVHIAFRNHSPATSSALLKQFDVVESLRILADPRFLTLEKLEVPPAWMVEPFKTGMIHRGVALAAPKKVDLYGSNMDHVVLTFASEE